MDTTTNTTSPTQSTTTASPRVTTNSNTSTSGSERSTTETTMPNPTFQAVQAELLSLEREVQSLEAKRDSLAQAIADQRGAGKSILDTEQKLSKLTLEATIASNQYVKLKTEYADALLRQAREVHDIRIVDEGATPLYPVKPVKIIYVAVGLVIGLLGGTLLALALDARQRSRAGVQPSEGSTNLRPPASQPTE